MRLTPFLRTVLKLDAASCLLMSAALLAGSGWLSPLFGMPGVLLTESGIVLALVGSFILWLGTREQASLALVRLVVFGNVGWTLASLASLALLPALTVTGLAATLVQALAVLVFAALEWRGASESAWTSQA
jgi:hypothetical protein